MSQTKRDISLSGAIKEALAFNDPRMSDRVFEQKLVKEIYQDDWAIRLGTRNPDYRTGLKKLIRRDVKEVIREVGRDNPMSSAHCMSAREPIFLLTAVAPAHGRGLKLPDRNANRTRGNQDGAGNKSNAL